MEGHKPIVAGEGGMFITNNQDYYERAILLGHFGDRAQQCVKLPHNRRYVDTGFGHKYRMHPLAAAIANAQLAHLDTWNEMRRQNLDYFSDRLRDVPGITPPVTRPHVTRGGFYGYKPVYEPEVLDGLPIDLYIDALRAEGVRAKRPDSPPLHLLPLFQDSPDQLEHQRLPWVYPHARHHIRYRPGDLPVAERIYDKLLSLPTFTDPAKELIDQYVVAFAKVAANAAELMALRSRHQKTGAGAS